MGSISEKYCIVGVGETPHMRPSGRTTLSMACEAVKKAMDDAGLKPRDIDGMTSYQFSDSCSSDSVAAALGIRLNYSHEILGGGTSTEALVGKAIGLIEAGYCKVMVIFRSMNGRSGVRMGGQAPEGPAPPVQARGYDQFAMHWGATSPAQYFAPLAMRYLRDSGATTEAFAEVAVAHRYHASLNPKAWFRTPLTIEEHQRSRWIVKPFRLLDCCLETDVAAAIIVTSRERAYDLRQPPVFIMGGLARSNLQTPGNRLFAMAGVSPKDVDLVSAYDAFTWTALLLLEYYGFCGKHEAPDFVKGGRLQIDRDLPANLSGGHLSEGYTHGVAMVIENVRQLRHRADDACPGWAEGKHSYDRKRGCRQVRNARIAVSMGEGGVPGAQLGSPADATSEMYTSALLLRGIWS